MQNFAEQRCIQNCAIEMFTDTAKTSADRGHIGACCGRTKQRIDVFIISLELLAPFSALTPADRGCVWVKNV